MALDQVQLSSQSGTLNRARKWLSDAILPTNMATAVSRDYLPTRQWMCLHDLAFNIGNFATGAAVAGALGVSPIWGGVAMNTFNQIRDKLCQTAGFATNFTAFVADKNPRPWMLAGTLGDSVGMVAESCAALVSPQALLPMAASSSVFRVFTGCMKGAAMADIDYLQARDDNVGDIRRKNGVQGYFVGLAGTVAGAAAVRAMTPWLGAWTAPAIALGSAVVANLAMGQVVKNFEFHPVNDQVVRELVRGQGRIPKPDQSHPWSHLSQVRNLSRISVGRSLDGLRRDSARFETLLDLYKGRNYLLDLQNGKPYIVLHQDSTPGDRFLAVLQAAHIEQLQTSAEFSQKSGQEATDWLLTTSLKQTPSDPRILLERLKEAGWTTDKLRFFDDGERGQWDPEGQFSLPLPEPPAH